MNKIEANTVIRKIRIHFLGYMKIHNLKSVVIGISGGIDSSLCAALLKPVMDELDLPLIGVSLPHASNKSEEILRAYSIGKHFCTKFCEQSIRSPFECNLDNIDSICGKFNLDKDKLSEHKIKVHKGNIKARVRMIQLYALAGLYDGMVISTDNLTEYLLGFWTLHGDVGDYGPIQNLWKTEIYEVATYLLKEFENKDKALALQACIEAQATDGLGVSTTSLEQLEAESFVEVDNYLKHLLNNSKVEITDKNRPIINRYLRTQYKRNNPCNIPREDLFKE